MRRLNTILVGVLAWGVFAATPLHALELFGRCLIGPCQSESESDAIAFIDPVRYDVALDISGSADVRSAVESASKLWRGRNDAVGGSAGLLARAQADYRRMLAALYNEGHYGGAISIKLNGIEASNMALGTVMPDNASVYISVEAGPQYTFSKAQIDNAAPPATGKNDEVKRALDIGFADGEVARASTVKQAGRLEVEAWRQQGYALAQVADQNATADHPQTNLRVRLGIDPGPFSRYGDLRVSGTQRMDPAFVARQAGLVPGAQYDPDDIEKARKRIERLGVFSVSKFEEAQAVDDTGALPITLTVEERKLRRIGAGATYSNFDGLGAEAFWLHRNLFGKAERLRLDAQVGGIGETFNPSKFTYGTSVEFTRPGFHAPANDLNMRLYAVRETNENYIQTLGGFAAEIKRHQSDTFTFGGGAFTEYGRFEDTDTTRDQNYLVSGLFLSGQLDTRDNALAASRGFFVTGDVRPFYEFEFSNAGVRLEAEARSYLALDRQARFVLAGRAAVGSVFGPDTAQTPDNMLFFAGGGGSVRGYGYKNIGVDEGGTTSGGKSKIELSLEARAKLTDRIGAVAFVDAASVSGNALFADIADWKVGVGAGLRYNTGLGPLRLDVALPLNADDGDPAFGIYAGIGQAF